jgi:hypothetical protein
LSVISGEENIHPAQASLDDVTLKIWNDYAGFSPELRENLLPPAYPQRLERLEPLERIDPRVDGGQRWNGWNDWN